MFRKEAVIEEIIKKVLGELKEKELIEKNINNISSSNELYIFENMEIAISKAKEAFKKLRKLSIGKREEIVNNIRKKCVENAEYLSNLAVEETGMGRVEDKIIKHKLIAEKTPGTEDLKTTAWSGDGGLTLIEQGPFGIIAAITPSTNPTATVLCNSIGMIAAGNTVVFAPHPNSVNCSNLAVKLVNEASVEVGGPENIVVSIKKPSIEGTKALMEHKDIALISATGGPSVVKEALSSGKRALGAGAGNPPVIVDETANIKKAAIDIIKGATFDNNLPCIAEKEVIAVSEICDDLIGEMIKNGAYYINDKKIIKKLEDTVLIKSNGKIILNRKFVGKDAKVILKAIGIEVCDSKRCIIFEGSKDNILIKEELMMPILGIVRAENFNEAMEYAIELENGNRHSAHMHSKNIDNLTKFARAIDTAIFVKNAPSYSALGVDSEGYVTFTIASKTGEGLTSAKTFTKNRRCVLSDGLSIR
ncbi:aldehyde dehydrogenase family protein [Clostridium fallax]|uniref:Propionaldehyde dehydrogenase n=1 Tax=Clostridium fallax TaxID=1533 RepID=A0A1M4XCB4_9CLOT|nr:aldehyde dehydrogenase family protein [Clostridium fallax]SHE90946.1 propionaldehyde dehydrogenase [Clostridium fallax]SQB05989.1 aldehyde dehydrogenase [Clostridium fallax]